MLNKWNKKYLLLAKALAEDNNICFSRKIGVILVSENNTPVSFGYNGPPRKSPHVDSKEYLDFLWDKVLSNQDKEILLCKDKKGFLDKYTGCQICPRRALGLKSGEKLEVCGCGHAERNALANAAIDGHSTKNCTAFCWCPLPCVDCTIQMIQSMVKKVVCLYAPIDYSPTSRQRFAWAGVEIEEIDEKEFLPI